MKISDIIQIVQSTPWTKINNFRAEIAPIGGGGVIDAAIVSIDTPEYTNAEIAEFIGGEWKFHVGRDELFRTTVTIRDFNQMSIYKRLVGAYNDIKDKYFDEIKFSIKIYNCEDTGVGESLLFETDTAIIESISQIQFNQTSENQIAEFSVRFKSQPPRH